jgi:hypothetical protein
MNKRIIGSYKLTADAHTSSYPFRHKSVVVDMD